MKYAKSVEEYLRTHDKWQPILEKLRALLLNTEMEETVKWGAPTYTINGKNVVAIGAFKSYAGIWFFQGALLSDPKNILINAQEGKTQALRQIRFDSAEEVNENMIKAYVDEAIENQKAGREIKTPKRKPFTVPVELKEAMEKDLELKEKYEAFSHAHRREYAEYISQAKRPETRLRRLEKIIPMIKSGSGLNDKYR